ncbi:hypothetical protein THRCLA_22543 [Thraustotheca clavata]|uniref:Uncharacterized protein n=1 Tax=Thraustotheca clavata TaxID=74557 RepID=A0A1V9YXZ0_9STRA|nr:hypothetical protein THRCLA_22543 [Thraustotheca clavata]
MAMPILLNADVPKYRSISISSLLSRENDEHILSSNEGDYQKTLPKYCCSVHGCSRVSQRYGLCHRHGGKRTCKYENCQSKDRGSGYCIKHGGGRPCEVISCSKRVRRKGMCAQHFRLIYCDNN